MVIDGIESAAAMMNTKITPAPRQTQAVDNETRQQEKYIPFTETVVKPQAGNQSEEQMSGEFSRQGESDELQIQDVSADKIKSAIKDVNNKIKATHTECQFSFHEDTKRISIKVLDKDTQKVIREIPPEKTLDMIAKAWELAGILVDEKR